MNTIVKFRRDAFKKGVNDTLTLAPLRDLFSHVFEVATSIEVVANSKPKPESSQPNDKKSARG